MTDLIPHVRAWTVRKKESFGKQPIRFTEKAKSSDKHYHFQLVDENFKSSRGGEEFLKPIYMNGACGGRVVTSLSLEKETDSGPN